MLIFTVNPSDCPTWVCPLKGRLYPVHVGLFSWLPTLQLVDAGELPALHSITRQINLDFLHVIGFAGE